MPYPAEQPHLLEYLVGVGMMRTGLESIERTLSNSTSTSNRVAALAISKLEQSKTDKVTYTNSLKREYTTIKNSPELNERFGTFFYQHNKTANKRAELFRQRIAVSSLGCNTDTTKQQEEMDQLAGKMRVAPSEWPIVSPNYLGKLLNAGMSATHNDAKQYGCDANEFNQHIQELLQKRIVTATEPT